MPSTRVFFAYCCIILTLLYFQSTVGSSLFREDMEGGVETEIRPPPLPPATNPLSDVLSVILQPLQYLSVALENILRLFVQLGQKIAVGINDKLTAVFH